MLNVCARHLRSPYYDGRLYVVLAHEPPGILYRIAGIGYIIITGELKNWGMMSPHCECPIGPPFEAKRLVHVHVITYIYHIFNE